ncbi:MAG TPA: SOS response-associated peptidase [Longimicrobiaceae bacterium]|nr:SOS response-associated peptidase [Longimicrobiaceae bacterium]
MCGRFGVTFRGDELAAALDAVWRGEPLPQPRYNVAPTQHAPVLFARDGERVLEMTRWGLIPSWAKDPSIGSKMINARAETVAEKPSYRAAFRKRRCLVPMNGFFEWKRDGKAKVPHWIHARDGGVVTVAGLWERWYPADAEPVTTFTVLTTAANAFMSALHDRMPVIISPDARAHWLAADAGDADLSSLLAAAPEDALDAHPVSTRVNAPSHDAADCIERSDATS